MVEYKKFKVGELFDIHPTKSYKMTNRKLMDNDGKVAVLTNTSINNGVGGWSNLEPTEMNSLPMITFSDTTTGPDTLFVQTKPYIGYSHVQGMYSKIDHHWTDLELLYVVVAIKAGAGTGWSYATKFNRKRVSNLDILLPVTSAGQPDFEYMTQYIKDMEWQCVDDLKAKQKEELQAYLQVTGFTDTTLSGSEAAALTKKVVWKTFKLGSLCDFESVRQAKSQKAIPDDNNESTRIPYIVQSMANNMFRRNVNRQYLVEHNEPIVKGNCIALGVTLPAVSYQPNEFGGSQLIIARAKSDWMNGDTGLYLATAIRMHMSEFSYNRKPGMKIYKAMDVMLPVTPNNQIDFDYMQNYIRAIEKRTIKNVVKYRNNVINTTQQVVDPTV